MITAFNRDDKEYRQVNSFRIHRKLKSIFYGKFLP